MMIELKNCPFCDGAVTWCMCDVEPSEHHDGCHLIECPNCGLFDAFNIDDEGLTKVRENAAKKWNTRPEPLEAVRAEIEKLPPEKTWYEAMSSSKTCGAVKLDDVLEIIDKAKGVSK